MLFVSNIPPSFCSVYSNQIGFNISVHLIVMQRVGKNGGASSRSSVNSSAQLVYIRERKESQRTTSQTPPNLGNPARIYLLTSLLFWGGPWISPRPGLGWLKVLNVLSFRSTLNTPCICIKAFVRSQISMTSSMEKKRISGNKSYRPSGCLVCLYYMF